MLQLQMEQCDTEIEKMINSHLDKDPLKTQLRTDNKIHKRVNKNAPKNMDINQLSYQYFGGIDLMSIEGVSHSTVIALMSEVGLEGMKKFETAKQFACWLD